MTADTPVFAVVVLYNQSCLKSTICEVLSSMYNTNLQVVIYDNSTNDYKNAEYCERNSWKYLGTGVNIGLSKAYNQCIDYILRREQDGYLCFFDDDTIIDKGYFNALSKAAEKNGKLFAPLVFSNNSLLSPCRISESFVVKRMRSIKTIQSLPAKNITAINSGLAVSLSLFSDYRYDENIFLDGIDHKFLRDMINKGNYLQIMDYRCLQQFSGDDIQSLTSSLFRFSIFAKDYAYIMRDHPLSYWYISVKRCLKLSWQHKTFAFFKELFTSFNSRSKAINY